jgi:toxin ParE1/3/4
MPEYRFTQEANDDLQGIIDYTIEHWGKAQAHKYIDGFEELAARLAENPALGANRNQLIDGLISFPYVSHILYYVSQDHGITIIRVLHKSMDAKRHFEKTNHSKN